MFCYSDTEVRSTSPIPINKIDPHKPFSTHLDNHYYLMFILENSNNPIEKAQASKELAIAERKLNFWKRHPLFESSREGALIAEARRKWNK